MNMIRRTQIVLATSAAALALVACGQQEDTSVGQKIDGAIEQTEQAAVATQQEIQSAATDLKNEGEKAAQAVSDSANDLVITAKVKAILAEDAQLSALRISVDTENAVVSLQGSAPSKDVAERATVLAKAVEGVNDVNNMLSITGQS
jgi:hyperosmotically inducible protein